MYGKQHFPHSFVTVREQAGYQEGIAARLVKDDIFTTLENLYLFLDLSQEELADLMNCSHRFIRKILMRQSMPKFAHIATLCVNLQLNLANSTALFAMNGIHLLGWQEELLERIRYTPETAWDARERLMQELKTPLYLHR